MIYNVNKSMPVFTTILKDKWNLKTIVEKQRLLDGKEMVTNVKAWRSGWSTHKDNPEFMPFANEVTRYVESISQEHFNPRPIKYFPVNLWAMIYEKEEYAQPHNHFPCDFSSVYYVDVDTNASPIIFEEQLEIHPYNGMLVIWQGVLEHKVPKTKGRRIAISTNFRKRK